MCLAYEFDILLDELDENDPRDKALVMTLYVSGCGVGEILSLRVKHVTFDEFGAVLMVAGKTGERRVRVVSSASETARSRASRNLRRKRGGPP